MADCCLEKSWKRCLELVVRGLSGKKKAVRDSDRFGVREGGVEPPHPYGRTPLKRMRLPIPPFPQAVVSKAGTKVSGFRFDANIFFKNINFIRRGRSAGAFWALPESVKVPPETLEISAKKAVVIFGKRRIFSGSGGYFRFSGGFLKLFFDLKKFTCFAFSDANDKSYLQYNFILVMKLIK